MKNTNHTLETNLELNSKISELTSQRDELLKAIENTLLQFTNNDPEWDIWVVKYDLENTLKKVKGE